MVDVYCYKEKLLEKYVHDREWVNTDIPNGNYIFENVIILGEDDYIIEYRLNDSDERGLIHYVENCWYKHVFKEVE